MSKTSPEQWLEQHGDAMLGYAYQRVRDRNIAEDLVQEALLAALKGRATFAGESSERTWLIGILKHKIIDYWRKQGRRPSVVEPAADEDGEFFGDDGHWRAPPSAWSDPDLALENQEFWRAFRDCLDGLPPQQAQAFGLYEIDGVDGAVACKALGISSTNLWVMLHRARMRLRRCLENHWFAGRPAE